MSTAAILFGVIPALSLGISLLVLETYGQKIKKVKLFHSRSDGKRTFLLYIAFFFLLSLLALFVVQSAESKNLLPYAISLALLITTFILRMRSKDEKERRLFQEELDRQLPPTAQVLTILVSAGLSPLRAMEIIALNSSANIGREFGHVVRDVREGASMAQALDDFGKRGDTTLIRRFVTSMIFAIERGSPLVNVLVDQVRDARNEAKNALLRKAGKSEIALMVPVVFLILPISVLFALWPSIQQLDLSIGF